MTRASCVYLGTVQHARHQPRPHRFRYRLFQLYLDLDELPELFEDRWLWSHERWNVASFRRKHYLGADTGESLKSAVRERVRQETGTPPPEGPVRVLTHLAFFGYCFNPVSFYYLFEEDGTTLHAVVAEITNTPWKERFQYVLDASAAERRDEWLWWSFDKRFHVSPFFDMDHRYLWSFTPPGERLGVFMENRVPGQGGDPAGDGSERVFDVALELERRPLDAAELRRCLLRHPFMTGKVHGAIYWQALRLWLKRTPFFTHPSSRPTTG